MKTKKRPKWPQIYAHAETQAHYEKCRANGCTDAMAQMLAERQAPGTMGTERAFSQGRGTGSDIDTMSSGARKKLLENCKKMGIDPGGKMYVSQLARRGVPCDPLALVNGLDDVKARANSMGRQVCSVAESQEMEYQGPPPKSTALAEDLVQEEISNRIRKDPGLKKVAKAKIREQVIHEHGFRRKQRT